MPLSHLSTPVALLVGALLIALALVARPPAGRYQLVPLAPGAVRIDTRTGETQVCRTAPRGAEGYYLACWR